MTKPTSSSAALPIAYVVLRILIVANGLMGVAILALLLVSPNEQWIMRAFRLSPSPEAERLVMGLRAIAVLGLAAIPVNHAVLKGHPLDLDAGFSVSGWLAVLLTFLLARVFAEGTLMRQDLEGTV
jgi:hypothetical protein